MRDKKNLQKLLNLTRHSEQIKTHDLSQRLQASQDANLRLKQLKHYYFEYENGKNLNDFNKLQNQRNFSLQLTKSIEQQKAITKNLEEKLKPSYKDWMMAKQRREAVEDAIEESNTEQRENEERQLQKDMESYAARSKKTVF